MMIISNANIISISGILWYEQMDYIISIGIRSLEVWRICVNIIMLYIQIKNIYD
jgi:hypothetical protein